MMLLPTLALFLGLAAASPIEERDVQTVHLTFHGGPAQYSMAFPADGKVYKTNNNIAVNIIDAPDYNALSQCTFYTPGEKALVGGITADGIGQVIIGPPQPVTGVSCQGVCLPIYGDCYRNGQFVAPCCNGYCAANKCRPWVSPY